MGRRRDVVLVFRTAPLSAVAMVATYLATTSLPRQDATFLGAGLSLVLFCVQVQRQARLVSLTKQPTGRREIGKPPAEIPDASVTVLGYVGAGIFAELERIDERRPTIGASTRAAVVLEVRTIPDVPSATMVAAFGRWATRLREQGCRLILAGVDDELSVTLERSGLADAIGGQNIGPATGVLFEAVETAYAEAEAWLKRSPTS